MAAGYKKLPQIDSKLVELANTVVDAKRNGIQKNVHSLRTPDNTGPPGNASQNVSYAVCFSIVFRLPLPDDFHVHLRQGERLPLYVRDHAATFGRGLVMPNTVPPVSTASGVIEYRRQLEAGMGSHSFEPLMTFKLLSDHDPDTVHAIVDAGVSAAKYYPRGATTNSEDGIEDLRSLYPAIAVLEERDVVLSLHGEDPGAFCLERERAFLPHLEELVKRFPRLRIVLEHVSTKAGVEAVRMLPENVAGSITAHHLVLTLDDVVGGLINPHYHCKPILKTPEDQRALREAAVSGERNFFFGSDSAPHRRGDKECACGCAGVYTAPVAVPVLASVFEHDCGDPDNEASDHAAQSWQDRAGAVSPPLWVQRLQAFMCENGRRFYRLPPAQSEISLIAQEWQVPEIYHDVVPLFAGRRLRWRAQRL